MNEKKVPSPDEIASANTLISKTLEQLDTVVLGHAQVHEMVLVALLSKGHVLLEGVPGVGKTVLVKTLSHLLGLAYNRVQFTPDLMPGDILGHHILQERGDGKREMVFQKGPVFTNVLLADEINRATPKTQSALLEAMQERAVTLLGSTRKLPAPFFVLATQNPIELEGTYNLPEAQLDRFFFKLRVGMVEPEILQRIISTRRRGEPPVPDWSMGAEKLGELFAVMERIVLPGPVSRYVSRLVGATHPDSPEATEKVATYVSLGASPRAAIAIAEASRAYALVRGRPTVCFDDVRHVAPHALNHRIMLNYKARMDRADTHAVIGELLSALDETGINLPDNMEIR